MREIYKGKHDALLGELKPLEKRFEITGEFAGLHVLLKDRKKEPEQQLLEKAAEKKVRVYGLSRVLYGESAGEGDEYDRSRICRTHGGGNPKRSRPFTESS